MSETWKEETGSDAYGRDSMEAVNELKPFIESVKAAALQSKASEERESKEENGA